MHAPFLVAAGPLAWMGGSLPCRRGATAQVGPPHKIHRMVLDGSGDDAGRLLKVVNVGDRGSVRLISGGSDHVNSTVKDGCDDFAILLDPNTEQGGFDTSSIWIVDGRTGLRYKDPVTPSQLLSYDFDVAVFVTKTSAFDGMEAAGGKDLVGDDDYPDLLVGAPSVDLGATVDAGRAYVLDMNVFNTSVDPPAGNNRVILPYNSGGVTDVFFGSSVALLGDFANNQRSEVLIGSNGTHPASGRRGRAYVLDLEGDPEVLAFLDAETVNSGDAVNDFGAVFAMLGNMATRSGGVDEWGRDGTPELAVADPFYDRVSGSSLRHGLVGWFNSFQVDQAAPSTSVAYSWGPELSYRGAYMISAGDQDAGSEMPGASTESWDLNFGQPGDTTYWIMPTDPVDITQTTQNQDSFAQGGLFPNFALQGRSHHADQMAAVGDIDNDGNDDFAYVRALLSGAHEVRVVSGTQWPQPTVSPMFVISTDPGTGKPLLGTPLMRRTSVTKLGDTDGDGLDDFGVVSGYSDTGGSEPTHGVVLVYGSTLFTGAPPPVGLGVPRIQGNKVAQRLSRIALFIDNCAPFATGKVYENTSLLSPPKPECLGLRRVGGTQYPFTCDSAGQFYFVRDLEFDSTDPDETTPGTVWYYQVKIQPPGFPSPPCKLSSVWELTIINTSNHLDEYRGDS